MHIFPEILVPTDVYAIDMKGWDGWHGYPANFKDYAQALRRVLQDPAEHASYLGDGLILADHSTATAVRPLSAVLGGEIALIGYQAPPVIHPGQRVRFVLRWRALISPRYPYTAFIHFGSASQDKLAQRDSWPWQGYYPTTEWKPGQDVDDPYWLDMPATLPAGQYRAAVGMYYLDPSGNLQPLKTVNGSTSVTIGPFSVSSP